MHHGMDVSVCLSVCSALVLMNGSGESLATAPFASGSAACLSVCQYETQHSLRFQPSWLSTDASTLDIDPSIPPSTRLSDRCRLSACLPTGRTGHSLSLYVRVRTYQCVCMDVCGHVRTVPCMACCGGD
uniref:Secreted protein n=1 Tax=Vitrella brassicaformis TaxID=1169539 RepID=A0A7S1K210_9ALVE